MQQRCVGSEIGAHDTFFTLGIASFLLLHLFSSLSSPSSSILSPRHAEPHAPLLQQVTRAAAQYE